MTYTCTVCGKTKTEVIPATGSGGDSSSGGSYDEESASEAIENIISSVAAGTQSETDENSSYDESLDLNGDGLNDLLDILSILYTM